MFPTNLHYRRASYGPYAAELKGIESRLVNNGIITSTTLGRMIELRPGPTLEDARTAYAKELEEWEARNKPRH